jgi:hypothetical protein
MGREMKKAQARTRPASKKAAVRKRPKPPAIDADRAKQIAIEYCLFHYPTLYSGGIPRRLPPADHWQVPVMLEDPDAGISAQFGELHIDAQTGKVIAATPPPHVIAGGEKRYQELQDAQQPAAPPPAQKR